MGDLKSADSSGLIPVWGANGVIGNGAESNLTCPAVIVGQRGSVGTLAIANPPAWITNNALVAQPHSPASLRFLYYSLLSVQDQLGGVATAVPMLTQEMLRSTYIPWMDEPTTRAIADFLDAETARIDALITKKQALINLVREREASVVDIALWSSPYATARLKHLAGRPTSGNRDHTFTWSDDGIPCLRGLNIRPMRIDRSNLLRISTIDAIRHSATALRRGDVVVVRSGNAGAAAVVPNDLDGANCVDLIVIRRTRALLSNIIAWSINSARTTAGVVAGSDNAALRHFNADDAAELLVPVPPLDKQAELERTLMRVAQTQDRLVAALVDQIKLLRERRRASITAAVTGELDIRVAAA
jgi:type I restriction enzyme, S subunit